VNDVLERIIRGPEPPVGIPYRQHPTLRCVLGLHRWDEVWDFTQIHPTEYTQDGRYGAEFAVNLDRPCDYVECARCGRMRG
jgi:hypothetical protein